MDCCYFIIVVCLQYALQLNYETQRHDPQPVLPRHSPVTVLCVSAGWLWQKRSPFKRIAQYSCYPPFGSISRDTVEITGNGFLLDKASNLVKFNGKSATVTTAGKNGLKVLVLVDATTGKVTITVAGITVASTDIFKVIP